jgi:outer membrane protein TolC
MVAGGLGSRQQESLADSQVASAEQQKSQADRAIDAARSSLSVLVGQGPDRGLAITRPHLLDPVGIALPDKLSVDLIGRRADLVAARWQVEAASRNIKATKTEFLPNVSLGAMAGFLARGKTLSIGNLFQTAAGTCCRFSTAVACVPNGLPTMPPTTRWSHATMVCSSLL